ncbi:MAG: hypothetical protein ACJ0F0_03020 [Burkholderiaceae bacterium]
MIINKKIITLFLFLLLSNVTLSHHHEEQDYGTIEEARELLLRATNLLKIDEIVGLTMMSVKSGGFVVKDLYPFCFDKKLTLVSHPYNLGASMKDLKDIEGNSVSEIIMKNAKDGQISEITYTLGRYVLGDNKLPELYLESSLKKTALYTRAGKYYCMSGYYKK